MFFHHRNKTSRTMRIAAALFLFLLSCTVAKHAPAQQRVKLAIWGDSRENLDNGCAQIADVLLNKITDWDVQIHTGDFSHHGADEDWQRSLHVQGMDRLFVRNKILLCTSNHDVETVEGAASWTKYTTGVLPVNSADGTSHFYARHIGNVHVVCCDGYVTDKKVMQQWLDKYVATVKRGEWLIGVWHSPDYGGLTYKEDYLATSRPWLDALAAHGCRFVVHGHAHVYVRTKPLSPDGSVDDAHGIVHIINGCGGASWKEAVAPNPKIAFTPDVRSFPCITFLTFEGDRAVLQTVDARPDQNLKVLDEISYGQRN